MAHHETVATLPDDRSRKTPTGPRPPRPDAVVGSLQSQIDSLHTTVSLLMDKYELVEQRAIVAEKKADSLLELRDLGQLARERSQ